MDKSTCKLVEEEIDNNMPGDTKQWLSKLLEAPIMQADTPLCIMRFMHFALCIMHFKGRYIKDFQSKLFWLQHITWILGPLSFKKQIHDGLDVNGNNGWGDDNMGNAFYMIEK